MAEISKRERINKLLSLYGSVLSQQEKDDMLAYYGEDLSLGEIAENRKVSRNAVRLSLLNGEKSLEKHESEMHLLERANGILKELDDLEEKEKDPENKHLINHIKEELTHGI